MSKRVAALVLIMITVIGVNLGFVNWRLMSDRVRMNQIDNQSYMRDVSLKQGLQYLNQKDDWSSKITAYRMPSVVTLHMSYKKADRWTGKPITGFASGVVIGDGLILTASHVVDDEDMLDHISIQFSDGTVREGLRVAYPEGHCPDVGLIWFDSEGLDLHPVPMSDWRSDVVQGEPVLMMGAPQDNGHSVSSGVVSCVNRQVTGYYEFVDSYVQVDAPGNQGNSGGPVFDRNGKLIGIFVWLYVPYDGLCFMVPVDRALEGILSCGDPVELSVGVSG